MNDLIGAVARRTSAFDHSESDQWVRFRCREGRMRYVVRCRFADGYQAWCQHDGELKPEWYPTAEGAVSGTAAPAEDRQARRGVESTPWAA